MFDLVVCGSGPAGAAAAAEGRALGLSVALVDRAAFPRDKLCGGGVTGRAAAAIGAVFGGFPDVPLAEVRRVRLMAGVRVLADVSDAPPLKMIMRRDFDAALRQVALARGAKAVAGKAVPEGTSLRMADGARIEGRVLIGADGVHSAVARSLHGRAYHPGRIGFGLEVEVPGAGDAAELDFAALPWGYGWAFPKAGGITLGIGGRESANPAMRAAFDAWLAARGVDGARVKGHHLPFGDARPAPGRGAVLLAGDAAGLVDPITGEGIALAVESGRLAARAAAAAIAAGRPEAALGHYMRGMAPIRRDLARARLFAKLAYHPALQARFLSVIEANPDVQRRFLALMAGELRYGDFSLWRMLRRMAFGAR